MKYLGAQVSFSLQLGAIAGSVVGGLFGLVAIRIGIIGAVVSMGLVWGLQRDWMRLVLGFFVGLVLMSLWVDARLDSYQDMQESLPERFEEESAEIRSFPRTRDLGFQYRAWLPDRQGFVYLTVSQPDLEWGEQVQVSGKLSIPEDEGIQRYLIGQSTLGYLFDLSSEVVGERCDWRCGLMRNLHGFRRTGLYLIGRLYPGVEGEFLKGILLGYSDLIPEEVEQSFRSSGIRHILAISGYHVSLVVLVVYQGLRGLYMSRNKAIPITLITILGFVLVTGAAASTIRAGILAGILLISEWLGRYVAGLRPLALTACLMLVVQPLWGAYSLGFQLSFLAVVGILVFSDVMTTFSQGMAATRIREYTGETVAAQIMVTPLLLWSFGEISLVSILGNVLIIPFIPLIMLGGVVSVLVYSVVPFQIIGYPVYLLIQVVLWLTDTVASIPFAMVGIDGGDWNLLLGGYFLIGVGYGLMRWKKHTRVPPKDRA